MTGAGSRWSRGAGPPSLPYSASTAGLKDLVTQESPEKESRKRPFWPYFSLMGKRT